MKTLASPCAALAMGLVVTSSAVAQVTAFDTIDADRAACDGCRIEFERIAVLGDTAGPGRLGTSLYSIVRDSRGRYLVATDGSDGFAVYDPTGRFIRRVTVPAAQVQQGVDSTIVSSDAAPADSAAPAVALLAVSAGDTVHVLDAGSPAHTVLAPMADGFGVARSHPLPSTLGILWDALLLPDGEILMPGNLRDREHAGYPLHIVGVDGRIRFSFGAEVASWIPGDEHPSGTRKLAWADSGSVWAAQTTRYRVERWTLDGQRDLTLERSVSWFPPFVDFRSPTPEDSPQSWLIDLWQDADGRLWTLNGVADPDWHGGLRRDPRPGRPNRYVTEDVERVFDTVIEVLDPDCKRLLVSQQVPSFLLQKIDGDLVAGWRTSRTGPAQLDVWRVELHNPTQMEEDSCVSKR